MSSSSIQNISLCSYKMATRGKPIIRMDFVRPQGAIFFCEATFCIWLRTSVLLWESDWMLKVCFYKYKLMTKAKSPKAQSQIILISFYIVVPKCISLPFLFHQEVFHLDLETLGDCFQSTQPLINSVTSTERRGKWKTSTSAETASRITRKTIDHY